MSTTNPATFFPPVLERGARGPAVVVLQMILTPVMVLTAYDDVKIEVNGLYDEATERAVKVLQEILGVEGKAAAGKFDSLTQSELVEMCRIRIDIPASQFEGPTHYTNEAGEQCVWPPDPAVETALQGMAPADSGVEARIRSDMMGVGSSARTRWSAEDEEDNPGGPSE
ncbi:MAG: hypothetical protein Q7R62_01885 [bacterium]|nr:hypothetical protein [bacterium]